MRLRVGSTLFAANSTDVTRSIRAVTGDRGNVLWYVHTLAVTGTLEGDTQAEIAAASAALQDALGRQYQDIALLLDSGAASDNVLVNGTSRSGVRVLGLDFPGTYGGAEYATLRSFSFTAQAEYLADGDDTVRYTESVSVVGTGGPVFRLRTPIQGPPVRQLISTHSPVRATQSGTWTGLRGRPTPPRPLWPAHELLERRTVRPEAPRVGAGGFTEWPVSWSYEFESAGPLAGGPATPPRA